LRGFMQTGFFTWASLSLRTLQMYMNIFLLRFWIFFTLNCWIGLLFWIYWINWYITLAGHWLFFCTGVPVCINH
jgi:hypothetical protein